MERLLEVVIKHILVKYVYIVMFFSFMYMGNLAFLEAFVKNNLESYKQALRKSIMILLVSVIVTIFTLIFIMLGVSIWNVQ